MSKKQDSLIGELKAFMTSMQSGQQVPSSGSGSQHESPNHNMRDSNYASLNPNHMGNNYQIGARFTKIEFPRFDGDGLEGWLFKCDHFFQVDHTPTDA